MGQELIEDGEQKMSVLGTILLFIAFLVIHYFVSVEFSKAAAAKGWSQKKYMLMAFLLWIIGYMLIIALPDRAGGNTAAFVSDDLPEL